MNNRIQVRRGFIGLFFFLSLISVNATGQSLSVSTPQLSFGNVYENSPDSLQLTITNNTGRDVTVTNIRFYNTYGQPAFSANSIWFQISNNSSTTIWIRFAPRHNIMHNSEMVIENDGLRGDVTVDLTGQGKYSNHYYDLTENQSEENLKTVLGVVTGNGYVSLGYNVARDSMFMSIDNKRVNGQGASQNTLECVYTGRQAVGYTDRSDCQTNYSFNTEHTFPQTFFSSAEPMKSDLHHLFPTDNAANNERGDNPFGVVTSPTWNNGGSSSDGSTFEPRDAQKGVVARALFYFVLRYQNYSNFVTSQESILRNWYWNFPADAAEIQRNDGIDLIQHNRNPFIDYPVFLERIQSITSNSIAPVVSSIDLPQDTLVYGTIPVSTPVTYNFVVVNNGNVPVTFTNFSLTHPAEMSFATPANDTTLAPGDGLNIGITCNTSLPDSIRAFLSFNSNASGHALVTVPIFVNDLIYSGITEPEKPISFYPNPAHDVITVSSEGRFPYWQLYNTSGQLISEDATDKIDVHLLLPGIYFIRIGTVHKMFVKE